MRAKGLIPDLSGACWSLLLVGWYSVVSAAYGNSLKRLKQFKKHMGLINRLNNRLINFIQCSPPHNEIIKNKKTKKQTNVDSQ